MTYFRTITFLFEDKTAAAAYCYNQKKNKKSDYGLETHVANIALVNSLICRNTMKFTFSMSAYIFSIQYF
jgi:hypothetical protein